MSACSHAPLIEALHDGRLGPAEVASTRRHLLGCPACAALLADLEQIRASLGSAPPIDPLRHQRARLALLRAATTDPPPRPRRPAIVLACGVLLLGPAVWAATAHFSAPRLVVIPPQETAIRPAPAAVFHRSVGPRSDTVTLTSGVLEVEVPPQPTSGSFVAQTQDARIETEGATLQLEARDGLLLRVEVRLGSARLVRGGTSVQLSSGGSWVTDSAPTHHEPAAPETAAPAPAPPSARDGSLIRPVPRAPGLFSASATAASGPASSGPATAASGPATAASGPAASAADASSREFSEAMEALSRGDAGQAAARFERFGAAHPGDARADDAAYLRAIALQRAGRRGAAAAAAQEYLATRPRGAHREQAKK